MLVTTVRVKGTKWIIHCVPETEKHLKFIETVPFCFVACTLYLDKCAQDSLFMTTWKLYTLTNISGIQITVLKVTKDGFAVACSWSLPDIHNYSDGL